MNYTKLIKEYKMGGHVFKYDIFYLSDLKCKYCNHIADMTKGDFPKCLSDEEKLIKDIIE